MTHTHVLVDSLGTFSVRPAKIDLYLLRYNKYLTLTKPKSFEEYSHRKTIEKQYERYLRVKELLLQEEKRKYDKFKVKRAYAVTKTLEQQEENPGGNQEQSLQEGGDRKDFSTENGDM